MNRNLSVIIPALNEEDRILNCIYQFSLIHPLEIIVVNNGSTDNTQEMVERWIRNNITPCDLRIINLPDPGKGAAIRAGMLAARGEYCYMADCDLSTPAKDVINFIIFIKIFKADIVIGSRRMDRSKVTQSWGRKITSDIFHVLTRQLLPDIQDTQCGFKLFTHEAAQVIFSNVWLEGLAFDVEVLLEGKKSGYKILEIPVTWEDSGSSRVHIVRDGIRMALDLARLYKNERSRLLIPLQPL